MLARKGLITFGGREMTVIGPDMRAGDPAPEFTVTTQDWQSMNVLTATRGKVRVIAAVPSLDTPVCDLETHRFNEAAAALSDEIVIVTVSADLPFAQKRWCGANGIEEILVVSDHHDMDFGKKYGCLMQEVRLLRRAVFVVGRDDRIVYADYMPELGMEPDYAAVLAAARQALG